MGNWLSHCLPMGGARNRGPSDGEFETDSLFGDPNSLQYGSFDPHFHGQEAALENQRELEALQRIVARTSNNLIDIYEIAPDEYMPMRKTSAAAAAAASYRYTAPPSRSVIALVPGAGQLDMRMAHYQTLLSRLAAPDDGGSFAAVSAAPVARVAHVDWGDDEAAAKVNEVRRGGKEGGAAALARAQDGSDSFVGDFLDAASAM